MLAVFEGIRAEKWPKPEREQDPQEVGPPEEAEEPEEAEARTSNCSVDSQVYRSKSRSK